MSVVIEQVDLTLFGCPMHYLKARETIRQIDMEQQVLFVVNKGDAVSEVMKSLRQDGQLCEIESEDTLTTIVRVIKKQ